MTDRQQSSIVNDEEIEASLDRSIADIAAGRTYELDDTIAEIEADIEALERDRCAAKAEVQATGRK